MTNLTHSDAQSPDSSSPLNRRDGSGQSDAQLTTQVCYLPYDAGPQDASDQHASLRAGLRAVEPEPEKKHAIRGNLYIIVELVEPAHGNPASYTPAELNRISERLLGLVQTAYYTAKGSQTVVIERAIHQVHQELYQINQERPQTSLRAGITCACLLPNRLMISCSGPALALIATNEALEQFPVHQSAPDLTLGGSEQPKVHTYKRRASGGISFFIGSNRWLDHFAVRKLLGTVAQATVDDCDEIAQYISDESGDAALLGLLVAANLPEMPDASASPNRPAVDPGTAPSSPTSPAPTSPAQDITHQDITHQDITHQGSPSQGEPRGTQADTGADLGGAQASVQSLEPPASSIQHQEPPAQSNASISGTPLIRKRSSSLPTSVNATPPVVRAPEVDESATPHFEQTQEMAAVVELRPGPAPTQRKKSQSANVDIPESPPPSPSPVAPADPDFQYSRQGASTRGQVDLHEHAHPYREPDRQVPFEQQGPNAQPRVQDDQGWENVGADVQDHSRRRSAAPDVDRPSLPLMERWPILQSMRGQAQKAGSFFGSLLPARNAAEYPTPTTRQNRGGSHQPQTVETSGTVGHDTVSHAAGGEAEWGLGSPAAVLEGDATSGGGRYSPPPPATGSRARIFISLAILLAFLIFVVVYVAIWRQGIASTERAEELVTAAESHINNARASLVDGNNGNARVSLQTAQGYLIEAEQLRGQTNRVDRLMVDIRQELQTILQVTPLYGLVSPLVTFPFEASPHRVLVVDQDIYILDNGQNQIIRYRLDESRSSVPDQAGSVILKQGQNVEGVTVGPLVDISWQLPIPGVMDKANLMVLDGNNNVFRYNQRVDGAALQTFGEQDQWQTPTQIQTYIGRLYIADGGRGQIYRYSPGEYDQPPEPWLIAPNPSAISSLSSMMIDGDIWLLFNNGQLLRYHQGEQQALDLDNDVGKILEPVDLFVGTQDNSLVYLADAGEERILVFSKDGTYIHQLQAAEGNPLQELRGIFVDETARMIYLLTRRGLFQHPLVE